jgi:DNA polymerase-4
MQEAIPNRKLSTLIWMPLCIGRANGQSIAWQTNGGWGSENRGVVAAASYEARKFGVRSAISGVMAKKIVQKSLYVLVLIGTKKFLRFKRFL